MTPDDLARDRAIMDAATPRPWEADDMNDCVYGRPDPDPRSEGERDLVGCIAGRADRIAVVHAVNRLPEYIAEAEEMQRRVAEVEQAKDDLKDLAIATRDPVLHDRFANRCRGMIEALKILRGEL